MATKKNPAKASGELRIRMYRVGFGDFFLMTVPTQKGPKHILIDCGVTSGKTGKGDIGTIKAAVAHMAKETNGELELIIVTHRHKDHIIGFSRCPDVFKSMKVGAVWMSAWETEYDPNEEKGKKKSRAAALQEEMASFALGLQQHMAASGADDPDMDEIMAMLENATGFEPRQLGAAGGSEKKSGKGKGGGSNPASLAYLKSHKPQYYAKGDKPELPPVLQKAGLTAQILGPPPLDAVDFMRLMDLAKKGKGQYLGDESSGTPGKFSPFDKRWRVKYEAYTDSAFRAFERIPRQRFSKVLADADLRAAVKSAEPGAFFMAAKTLDDFLNNQSLVILFTFKGKKLLFAGDAQGGNWEYWMYGGTPTKEPVLDQILKESAGILGHLDFYKMGHHGSTNATPVTAVGALGGDPLTLCSTQEDSFGKEENQSEVPRLPLIEALEKKSKIVRSDSLPVKGIIDPATKKKLDVPAAKSAPKKLPAPDRGRLERGEIYIDYFL